MQVNMMTFDSKKTVSFSCRLLALGPPLKINLKYFPRKWNATGLNVVDFQTSFI